MVGAAVANGTKYGNYVYSLVSHNLLAAIMID